MPDAHDELLQPVLSEQDDARGFGHPFRPRSLVFATFFGGAFCGAILFFLNWRQLGREREAQRAAIGFCALGLVLVAGALLLLARDPAALADGDQRRTLRLALRVLSVLPAWFVARSQERPFRLFLGTGREPRPALAAGLGAVVAGNIVSAGLATLGALLLGLPLEGQDP